MEEREEAMVPFPATDGGEPTVRIAHFLKPTMASIEIHSTGFSNLAKIGSNPEYVKTASHVICHGWRGPQKGWKDWVTSLKPLYGDIWRKVGIFDAILASTFNVRLIFFQKELLVKLAEKWVPETNTFMFSWGEATITLEDLMVLGGFPVLGQLVIDPVETLEMIATEEKLKKTYKTENGSNCQRKLLA
ncbi:OLC1v1022762C1 [Oldenlandia corymbosa var. corymbosa]|uniref:OLC1v1022762C1 n=1 Tax=Oldenlandia corymbosa var. corymbosa TaxID=529605 RepID=A0AAV1BYI5_OLDCO|nr:OLC1v1022762C1 [Oldenlandia corymbosa var. corymbosa]